MSGARHTAEAYLQRSRTPEDEREDVIEFINRELNEASEQTRPPFSLRTLRRKIDAGLHVRVKEVPHV